MTRYRFEEVKEAVAKHWGLQLYRGAKSDGVTGHKDGRWDTSHSRTGFVVSGNFPGIGYTHRRYDSLSQIVKAFDLTKVVDAFRRKAAS